MSDIHRAGDPGTPEAELRALAVSEDPDVRMTVAGNPNTPLETLEKLAKDPWENFNGRAGVRQGVATNATAPTHLLVTLANDSDEQVRMAVAGNPNTPTGILAEFAHAEWEFDEVLAKVAGNPSTPDNSLAFLASLTYDNAGARMDLESIHLAVAENRSSSRTTLELLAQDEESEAGEAARAALADR